MGMHTLKAWWLFFVVLNDSDKNINGFISK
jgi:hypothetical protein